MTVPLAADECGYKGPQPDIKQRESLNRRSPSGSYPWILGKPMEEGKERFVGVRWGAANQRTWPTESRKQDTY